MVSSTWDPHGGVFSSRYRSGWLQRSSAMQSTARYHSWQYLTASHHIPWAGQDGVRQYELSSMVTGLLAWQKTSCATASFVICKSLLVYALCYSHLNLREFN